jgi:hypothetical protein
MYQRRRNMAANGAGWWRLAQPGESYYHLAIMKAGEMSLKLNNHLGGIENNGIEMAATWPVGCRHQLSAIISQRKSMKEMSKCINISSSAAAKKRRKKKMKAASWHQSAWLKAALKQYRHVNVMYQLRERLRVHAYPLITCHSLLCYSTSTLLSYVFYIPLNIPATMSLLSLLSRGMTEAWQSHISVSENQAGEVMF